MSKCSDVEQVVAVVQRHLKYFFDFRLFRMSFIEDNLVQHFTVVLGDCWLENNMLNTYEKELIEKQIPILVDTDVSIFESYFPSDTILNSPSFSGWHFNYKNMQVCVSILGDDLKKFDYSNTNILTMFVDNCASIYSNLRLSHRLNIQNKNLEEALSLVHEKNENIKRIVNQQKHIIEERTRDLKNKNDRLYELSSINAHNLREPLSRILGLIDISEHFEAADIKEQILDRIKISADDLDETLRDVIEKSASEIEDLHVISRHEN
jgi:signal transduction histidine kinase